MIAQVAAAYRAHWRTLLVVGLLVFVPLGLIELLDHRLQEPLADDELDQLDPGLLAAIFAAVIGHATAALLGEVVYAGIVAAAVTAGTARPPLRELLRHLPFWRLVCVDLLWVVVVVVGFLALVVPGLIFITWFALVAPAVEIEGRGVTDAFRRSRELVRRRFWFVLALILPVLVLGDLLSSAAEEVSFLGLGDGWAGEWVGSVLANLLASPLYALVAVFLFLGLRRDVPAAPTPGAAASPGTPPRSSPRSPSAPPP